MIEHTKWSDDEIAQLKKLRREGLHYRDIVPLIGRTLAAVKRMSTKLGIGMLDKRRIYPESEVQKIIRLREDAKYSFALIAVELRRSKDSVADCYYRHATHGQDAPPIRYEEAVHRQYLAACLRETDKRTVGDLKAWYVANCEHLVLPEYTTHVHGIGSAVDVMSISGSQGAMCAEVGG
jgi:hypothetical protein